MVHRLFLFLALALSLGCLSRTARADEHCGDQHAPATYAPQPGDTSDSTRLSAAFPLTSALHSMEINVCAGELRVKSAPHASKIELQITSPGADRSLREYLHDFGMAASAAHVSVEIPSRYHAVVTLLLPASGANSLQLNLGAGTLLLDMAALGARDREINVGAGSATLLLRGERDYKRLEVNVGMGHLEDDRPGGQNGSFVVSREMDGSGAGSVEVNVGAGNLVLKPAEE